MSRQMTSKATRSATSSPASVDGLSRSISLDGPTTAPSGPAPVPVSRFRARDASVAMSTNDTSGPLFTHSSPSAVLQRSLESRLRARMGVNGSLEYALTWSTWDMPSGPLICALRARAHRTSGSGFTGWPTPVQGDTWVPSTQESANREWSKHNLRGVNGQLTGWATPSTRDWKSGDGDLTNYLTRKDGKTRLDILDMQARLASGETIQQSLAATAKRAALTPAHSRWLMGFPPAWDACAPTATPSSRK